MATLDHPAARAWAKLAHHCDGIAIGTTVEALQEAGCFAILAAGPQPRDGLAATLGLRPGLFAIACKLLQSQGYLWLRDGEIGLTRAGLDWTAALPRYAGAAGRIEQAAALLRAILHDEAPPPLPGPDAENTRIWHQAAGPLAAAAAFGLDRTGVLARLATPQRLSGAALAAAAILHAVGWIEFAGDDAALTPEGRQAAAIVEQYAYPISYFPTFAAVPSLLRHGIPPQSGQDEWHVERGLDIAFSGAVVRLAAGAPAIECIRPIFDHPDLASQPTALVDTGSGDGTLLAVLFEAIRTRTRRGAALGEHPLHLVGIEYTAIARRTTQERLAQLPAPSLALPGDIGAPDAVAACLREAGLQPDAALHMSKSVLHNRTHRPVRTPRPAPPITAVFTDPSGAAIPAAEVYAGLVECLQAWRPLTAVHGMLAIEAHTVDPDLAARHVGRSLITALDAAHGYSGQLLMEIAPHRHAAAAAGYRTMASHELGAGMVGQPIMSVDHLMPT